jgi:hypothetical protein
MGLRGSSAPGDIRHISKLITFTGASTLGAINTSTTFFTVTGEIEVISLVPTCTVDLASADAATITIGVTGSTSLFLAATTATTIDVGEFWVNTTPVAAGVALPAAFKNIIITDNILGAVATGTISSGAVRFDLVWRPLSPDASVA